MGACACCLSVSMPFCAHLYPAWNMDRYTYETTLAQHESHVSRRPVLLHLCSYIIMLTPPMHCVNICMYIYRDMCSSNTHRILCASSRAPWIFHSVGKCICNMYTVNVWKTCRVVMHNARRFHVSSELSWAHRVNRCGFHHPNVASASWPWPCLSANHQTVSIRPAAEEQTGTRQRGARARITQILCTCGRDSIHGFTYETTHVLHLYIHPLYGHIQCHIIEATDATALQHPTRYREIRQA